jgi:hypothetical protein
MLIVTYTVIDETQSDLTYARLSRIINQVFGNQTVLSETAPSAMRVVTKWAAAVFIVLPDDSSVVVNIYPFDPLFLPHALLEASNIMRLFGFRYVNSETFDSRDTQNDIRQKVVDLADLLVIAHGKQIKRYMNRHEHFNIKVLGSIFASELYDQLVQE